MKAKVIIENGKTVISLTPENDFETDILEKSADDYKHKYKLESSINFEYEAFSSSQRKNYRLDVEIIKEKK